MEDLPYSLYSSFCLLMAQHDLFVVTHADTMMTNTGSRLNIDPPPPPPEVLMLLVAFLICISSFSFNRYLLVYWLIGRV